MKKILVSSLMFLMLLCLTLSGLAVGTPVIDQADLFTNQEEARLTGLIEQFREETGMDFGIITSYEAHGSTQQEVADALYERGGYGMGDERSGILYYIDMYERIPYLTTTGEMIDYMTDQRIENAHESCYDDLASGNYARAAETMISVVEDYVRSGIPEGQYQYDALTGRRLTTRHKALTSGEMLACAGVAALAALIFVFSVNHGYSLKGNTYDYPFRANSDVTVTGQADDYIRTTTTRTRKAPPPSQGGHGGGRSGGSRVHTSRGGMRHGGGAGRRF